MYLRLIGLVSRMFASGPGDLGSIPGCVIPTALKWYLIPPSLTLSNIRYVSRVKWSNPGKRVAPSPTSRCSSNWKGILLVALDYSRRLLICIYLWVWRGCVHVRERERVIERKREWIHMYIRVGVFTDRYSLTHELMHMNAHTVS